MEFDRVVQVRAVGAAAPTRAAFATGYLVAPRLVLTAAHVLATDGPPEGAVTVCRPTSDGTRHLARVLWRRHDGTVDAALLQVEPCDDWRVPDSLRDLGTRPPQRWGRLIGTRPHPVTVCGYPRLQRGPGGRVDEQLTGDVHPGTGRLARRYEVLSANPLPAHDPRPGPTGTPWSGISGAALLCGDLLTGLVTRDRRAPVGTRLTATRTRDLLADPDFRALIAQHTGWQPVLEPVEPDPLLAPAARTRDLRSPAMLLRADAEAVTFHGRDEELRHLLDWCRGGREALSVQVLTGPGGQGKTRLARQLAATLREDEWIAAQLRPDLADSAQGPDHDWSLLDTTSPLLLVVDYAETLPHRIRHLVERLRHTRRRTRLLLVARSVGEWKSETLGAGADTREILSGAPVTELAPLLARTAGADTRAAAFTDAVRDFARLLGRVPGLADADWPHLASGVRPPGSLDAAHYDSALSLQMSALGALLQRGPEPVGTAPGEPVEALVLGHEARYWEGTAASPVFRLGDLRPVTLRRAVAAAALCGAESPAQALAVTRGVPGLPDGRALDVAEWLHALYPPSPGRYWGSLQPDRLAEYHVAAHVTGADDQTLPPLWASASDPQRVRAITFLARAADAHDRAGRGGAASDVLRSLARTVSGAPPTADVLRAAISAVPYPTRSRPLALVDQYLHERVLLACRERAAAEPGAHEVDLTVALNDLSLRYQQRGRSEHAMKALEGAIGIGRRSARRRPERADKALTMPLYNLSRILGDLDRQAESLAALEESIANERRLVAAAAVRDASYLALVLYWFSYRLRRPRPVEAAAAAQESVDLYRELARANPAYDASLARALSNLHIQLDDLGRTEESMAALTEREDVRGRAGLYWMPDHLPRAGLRRPGAPPRPE
ncbi:AAA family ATPase [Streptomyces sp. cg36]|uniref:P-loop NTPase n=1 Tax=Streptomyces sp. cg36 TaxID=3238798 RepID=UPI0034E279AC